MTTETRKDELLSAVPDTDSADERMRDAMEAPEPVAEGSEPGQVIHTASAAVASGGEPAVPGGGNAGSSAVGGFEIEQKKEPDENAGWAWIWNQRSYERSKTLNYMLKQKLELRFDDGDMGYVWTTRQPRDAEGSVVLPWRGSNLCFLHANHPEREYHTSLGLDECVKSNLASTYQARRHAQKRHPDEWSTIEEIRDNERLERERRVQELQIAMAEKALGQTPTVEVAETPAQEVEHEPIEAEKFSKLCETCDKPFTAKTEGTLRNKLRLHNRVHKE